MKQLKISNFKFQIVSVAIAILFMPACTTTENGPEVSGNFAAQVRHFIEVTEPAFRPSAATACGFAISVGATEKDRAEIRSDIFVISSIVATANGQSPEQLEKAILAAIPVDQELQRVVRSIIGLYSIAFPFIKGDPALLIKVTTDLAAGCADATRPPSTTAMTGSPSLAASPSTSPEQGRVEQLMDFCSQSADEPIRWTYNAREQIEAFLAIGWPAEPEKL